MPRLLRRGSLFGLFVAVLCCRPVFRPGAGRRLFQGASPPSPLADFHASPLQMPAGPFRPKPTVEKGCEMRHRAPGLHLAKVTSPSLALLWIGSTASLADGVKGSHQQRLLTSFEAHARDLEARSRAYGRAPGKNQPVNRLAYGSARR